MRHTGFTMIETILAISFTVVIGAATASMMTAASTGLSSTDDGRKSAIRLVTTKARLSAYIAPSRCFLGSKSSELTVWIDDTRKSNTVHASEIRWITFDNNGKQLIVQFVSFPELWSQSMIDDADTEYSLNTNYRMVLKNFSKRNLIQSFTLIDSIASCTFWLNDTKVIDATLASVRYSIESDQGKTNDILIDETLRHHSPPLE